MNYKHESPWKLSEICSRSIPKVPKVIFIFFILTEKVTSYKFSPFLGIQDPSSLKLITSSHRLKKSLSSWLLSPRKMLFLKQFRITVQDICNREVT